MSRKILGLDIRHDTVSAALLRSGMKGNWIESHIHVPIPDQEDMESGLRAALETVQDKVDTTNTVCVVSFPADRVSYRNIQLPFRDRKKIRQVLPLELEPALPLPIEDMILDFHVIPDHIRDSEAGEHTDIIATGAEVPAIKFYLDMLTSLEMEPELLTIGGYTTALCLAKFSDIPEKCLFMDIDVDRCTAFVIIAREICLIRAFSTRSNPEFRSKALCTDIQRILTAFGTLYESVSDFHPDGICITGYGLENNLSVSEFAQDARQLLNIPVRQANLIQDAKAMIKTHPTTMMKTSVQMDNAFALALTEAEGITGLNFRKGPFAVKRQWAEHKQSFVATGIFAALLLIAVGFYMMFTTSGTEKKLAELDQQITSIFKATFPNITRIVDPLHQMQIEIQNIRKEAFSPKKTGNIRVIDVINNMSTRIPKEIDVEFTRLAIGPDNVLISGNTDTYNAVDEIKSQLEQADIFKEVTISSSNIDRRENRVRFKLRIQL